ncbi:MAG: aldo/keto reductase [Candidatus Bathyarchaeia archaeon]
MMKRRFGRTGLEVPIVGLGGAGLGQPIERIEPLINHALDRGANFIHVYPSQEENVGRVLSGRRDEAIIAAHVDVSPDPSVKMGTADEVIGRVDACLKNLGTDSVELFQFHGVMDEEAVSFIRRKGGALEGLKKARKQGKVQFIGITGHYSRPLVNALKHGVFDTVMVPFNIMRREFGADPAVGLFPLAKRLNIGVIIMKPIANGRITKNLDRALKFILAHDLSLAIPGAKDIAELEADIEIAEEFSSLSEEEQRKCASDEVVFGEPYCRNCGYCLPCPFDVNIPAILKMERTCTVFGLKEWIRQSEIGKLEVDAAKCEGCGACEPRCPFDLPICQMMRNAEQYKQAPG